MWFLQEINRGIETGLTGEIEMAEVIIWFIMMIIAMAAFFVWEYFAKLTDRD